jgi:hypothetical protein
MELGTSLRVASLLGLDEHQKLIARAYTCLLAAVCLAGDQVPEVFGVGDRLLK